MCEIVKPQPKSLVAFKKVSQGYFTAYVMAFNAMHRQGEGLEQMDGFNPDGLFQIAGLDSTDEKRTAVASMPNKMAVDGMRKGGIFGVIVASGILSLVFAAWEHGFRKEIADELGIDDENRIKSDAIGDLRLIRIEIEHHNSVVREKECTSKLKGIKLEPGPLQLGIELMHEIQIAINTTQIHISDE